MPQITRYNFTTKKKNGKKKETIRSWRQMGNRETTENRAKSKVEASAMLYCLSKFPLKLHSNEMWQGGGLCVGVKFLTVSQLLNSCR